MRYTVSLDGLALKAPIRAWAEKSPVESDAGFLDAIRGEPDEDVHRLVYADWLDDQGDADRAEFIRTQCALANLPEDDPDRPALEECERSLLLAHETAWLGWLPPDVLEWTFRRGFVDRVVLAGRGSLAGSEQLTDCHPVGELVLNDDRNFGAVLDSSLLTGTSALAVCPPLRRTVLSRFLRSPHRGGLRGLRLAGPLLDNSFAQALAASDEMPHLRALYLSATPIRDAGILALLRGRHLRELAALGLEGARLSGTGLAALTSTAHAPRWRELEWLVPFSHSYGSAGVTRLGACVNLRRLRLRLPEHPLASFPALPRLDDLTIENSADEHVLRLLVASGNLPNLRRLVLRGLRLNTAECWQALSAVLEQLRRPALHLKNLWLDEEEVGTLVQRVAGLERIASLDLGRFVLEPGAHGALTACGRFTGLAELSLRAGVLSNDALASLLGWPCLKRVRRLILDSPGLGRDGLARALDGSPHLGSLRELTLTSGGWMGGALEALAGWPGLARLDRLHLGNAAVPSEAVHALAESPHLSPLTWVDLRGTLVHPLAAQLLRARLGRRFLG
jgi:uncharacterized protein (TIGR02996 family)